MRACELLQGELERRLRGELGPEEGALLDLHLAGCADCRHFIDAVRAAEARLALEDLLGLALTAPTRAPKASSVVADPEVERLRRKMLRRSWLSSDRKGAFLREASADQLKAYERQFSARCLQAAMGAPIRILGMGLVATSLGVALGGPAWPVFALLGLTAAGLGFVRNAQGALRQQVRGASMEPGSPRSSHL